MTAHLYLKDITAAAECRHLLEDPILEGDASTPRPGACRSLYPLEPLLAADDVLEIMVKEPDSIFVRHHWSRLGYCHEGFQTMITSFRCLAPTLDGASRSDRKRDAADCSLASGGGLTT